jgi:IS605 OrfB family transposase
VRRTVKIKLDLSTEDRETLDATAQQFKTACNMTADAGWDDNGLKTYQKYKLQDQVYDDIRDRTNLQANLVIRAISRGSEAIKGCVERLKQGEKTSKPRFTSDSIAYDKRTLTVWLDEHRCTISTIDGRINAKFVIPEDSDYYNTYFNDGWTVTQSTVEKHEYEDGAPYYLHLGLEKESSVEEQEFAPKVMGVDLNVDNLAVTSTGRFFSGDRLHHERRRFEEIRGKLQEKGTRSAHRTIQEMSGRENRYACDTLHHLSKQIVEEAIDHDVDVIAFENLTDIRDNMPPGKQFHSWCFKKLFQYVEYKAQSQGIAVKQVSPKYTSQRCSDCGHTASGSRNGDRFQCVNCNKTLHADYNAAKNIGVKILRSGRTFSGRKGHGQLALKSGSVNQNGDYTASTA